ncbi:MAG: hypothetical protein GY811_22630 [Myxococcales bacterium]|nr:hypothetical protein [Myxococcales bacterium]
MHFVAIPEPGNRNMSWVSYALAVSVVISLALYRAVRWGPLSLVRTRPSIAKNMFPSQDGFDRQSPWVAARAFAADSARPDVALSIFSGQMAAPATYTARFREHLDALGVAYEFEKVPCPHDAFCFMTAQRVGRVYGAR